MIRTWNTLAMAALFAAAAPPVVTAGGTPAPDNKEILKKVEELSKKLDAAATSKEVKAVLTQLEKINRELTLDMTAIKAEQIKQKVELQSLSGKMQVFEESEIQKRLAAIEKSLAALQTKESVSRYPSESTNAGTSRVMLTNLYNERALFTVNGRDYTVEPNQTVDVRNVPSGALTYEVFVNGWGNIRPLRTVTLPPNETLMLTTR